MTSILLNEENWGVQKKKSPLCSFLRVQSSGCKWLMSPRQPYLGSNTPDGWKHDNLKLSTLDQESEGSLVVDPERKRILKRSNYSTTQFPAP